MTIEQKLGNLILHENAYFYSKDVSGYLSKSKVNQIFRAASEVKSGNYLLKIEPTNIEGGEEREAKFSLIVFKFEKKPSFIEEHIQGWEEWKLGFLCIIDYQDYLVIIRRNISNISDFLSDFEPIDYSVLTSIFSDNDSTFEKFTMNNISISSSAIRNKSLESLNLKESISGLGLQNYTLSNARIRQGENQVGLALNTSRINNLGEKKDVFAIFSWVNTMISLIDNCTPTEGFLNSFATPINFSQYHLVLKPNAILITLSKIYSDFEQSKIRRCYIQIEDKERNFDLLKFLRKFESYMEIVLDGGNSAIPNNSVSDLQIKVFPKSIRLQSKKLSKIFIEYENGFTTKILSAINYSNSFIVTFDEAEYIYTNRKLFKDSRLLGNIESLLKIFIPYADLETVINEKGTLTTASFGFTDNSIFGFTEKTFKDQFEFFVCDDLSREWADYIGLSETQVAFVHGKASDKIFSASAFQEVVGQALKNLGNILPTDDQWSLKENLWNQKYVNRANTQISRIRTGQNSPELIAYYKKIRTYPNLKKVIYLVINYISKRQLEINLRKLKNNETFRERNEVIQILWIISSLISSCGEANVEVYICCKP